MGLFDRFKKANWNHKNYKKRLEAVEIIDDPEILSEMAKNDSDFLVRERAIEKIEDESVLEYVAKNDKYNGNRALAIEKIKNESVLGFVAKHDSDSMVRKVAINNPNLKDKKVLEFIAKFDKYYEKVESYSRNTGEIIGYSDHDGDEYQWERVDVYEYPVRKAANKKLGGGYDKYCTREESSII